MASASGRKTFRLVLIKPSHYDDDGYVIQWLRSPIPANSLACLYGLAQDASEREALGADIDDVLREDRVDRDAVLVAGEVHDGAEDDEAEDQRGRDGGEGLAHALTVGATGPVRAPT